MDREIVAKVAKNAHISLTEEELERYADDLSAILDYFESLDEAPEGEGEVDPIGVHDVLRDDVPSQDVDPDLLLKDMRTYERYVRGPKLV